MQAQSHAVKTETSTTVLSCVGWDNLGLMVKARGQGCFIKAHENVM
jgi:hypothetical protein